MGNPVPSPETNTARQRRLHQCLCGYRPPNYSQYKKHLATCAEWRNRPNPRGMSIYRRALSRARSARVQVPSEADLREHDVFSRLLRENKIPTKFFAVFLRLLARRYGIR